MNSKSFPITGSIWSPASDGKVAPQGNVTLSYDDTQTTRSISVNLRNTVLPDGTLLNVVFYDVIITYVDPDGSYYPVPVTRYVPHPVGPMVVYGGTASMSVSTADDDDVPNFGPQSQIDVYMVDDAGNNTFDIAYGNYEISGGGGGGVDN